MPTTAPAEDEEREDEALAEMQATVVELEADNAALEAELADAEARELRMRARLQLRSRRWPGLQLDETVPLPPPGDEPSQAAPEAAQPAAPLHARESSSCVRPCLFLGCAREILCLTDMRNQADPKRCFSVDWPTRQ